MGANVWTYSIPKSVAKCFKAHLTLEPVNFLPQLEELRGLKDGWYDGRGLAPPATGLDWLVQKVVEWYPDNLPSPYVYPVVDGGVRFEWVFGFNEASLTINTLDHVGEWHNLNLKTDAEEAMQLELGAKEAWDLVAERLKALEANVEPPARRRRN